MARGDDFIIVVVFEVNIVDYIQWGKDNNLFSLIISGQHQPWVRKKFFLNLLLRKLSHCVIYALFIKYNIFWFMSLNKVRHGKKVSFQEW